MFKFNGGAGTLLCDLCSTIVLEPCERPTSEAASALCERCGEQTVSVRRIDLLRLGVVARQSMPTSLLGRGAIILATEVEGGPILPPPDSFAAFVEGLTIIRAREPDAGFTTDSAVATLFVGDPSLYPTDERTRLEALGWIKDAETWSWML